METPRKLRRPLVQVLHEQNKEEFKSGSEKEPCGLAVAKPCCSGLGFKLNGRGAYTVAEVCSCVKACRTCLGRAQHVEGGFARPCRQPSPVKVVNILNEAMFPVRYQTANFDTFANHTGNHSQILARLREWLSGLQAPLPPQHKGLILSGRVGVGKTYLLVAIGKALARRGLTVKFVDFFQLITEIKASFASNADFHQTLLAPLLQVDVLLIDELGKGRQTEFEHTIIDQLVMGRYNQNKMIVASTNCRAVADQAYYAHRELDLDAGQGVFNPKEFPPLVDRVGERIYSRLVETTNMWELSGEDFRRKKGNP